MLSLYGQPDMDGVGIPIIDKVPKTLEEMYVGRAKTGACYQAIIDDLDRSATYIKAKGMYTDAPRDMIFLVVSRKEVHLVQHQIREIDPTAFVVVTDAYETFGEGFKQVPDKNTIQAE